LTVGEGVAGEADPARFRTITRHGYPEPVLYEEIERAAPDLLVLGTHGRTGIAHAMLGGVAETFLSKPPCDVLVRRRLGVGTLKPHADIKSGILVSFIRARVMLPNSRA
jgi:hypothetical protein